MLRHVRSEEDDTDFISGGQSRRQVYRCSRPDIIILDVNLPGTEGRHVLQELMSDRDLSKIPIIVFSSSHAADDILSAYRLEASC